MNFLKAELTVHLPHLRLQTHLVCHKHLPNLQPEYYKQTQDRFNLPELCHKETAQNRGNIMIMCQTVMILCLNFTLAVLLKMKCSFVHSAPKILMIWVLIPDCSLTILNVIKTKEAFFCIFNLLTQFGNNRPSTVHVT